MMAAARPLSSTDTELPRCLLLGAHTDKHPRRFLFLSYGEEPVVVSLFASWGVDCSLDSDLLPPVVQPSASQRK